ncbi:NAD(P) transhydrogenase subunit alpha [Platysternon megacephalum]|uniref:NAD(P) transhydrogenase subunit alpha n=1 Tax=Platysternon megacephalum TaxID=55544 RepID=A0A4D9DGX7_9SAUR|nr:NAD(P) transhydrogenase subunit alpha [Platysternon megacephalum]
MGSGRAWLWSLDPPSALQRGSSGSVAVPGSPGEGAFGDKPELGENHGPGPSPSQQPGSVGAGFAAPPLLPLSWTAPNRLPPQAARQAKEPGKGAPEGCWGVPTTPESPFCPPRGGARTPGLSCELCWKSERCQRDTSPSRHTVGFGVQRPRPAQRWAPADPA